MSTSRYPQYGSQPQSLISEINGHFTPEVVRSARAMVGESESSTFKALHAATPTVLSGIANMASTSDGANNLASMIHEGGYGGLTENPMSLFRGGSATNYLLSAGQRHLGKIFGGNTSPVMDLVAKSGGVSASSATKLTALITPLALGVLGKRSATGASGSSGLTQLLSLEREEIKAAAPSGLSRILGFRPRAVPLEVRTVEREEVLESPAHIEHFVDPTLEHFVDPTPFAERPAAAVTRPREGAGGLRWIPLVLLVLGVLAVVTYLVGRSRAPRVGTRGIFAVKNAMVRIPLPDGVNLSVRPGSMNYQLANFLGNHSATDVPRTFVFDRLNFATGSTQLTADSNKTVTDLAQVLQAYPNAQVQLTGHTDNTGNPQSNQILSLDRANAIKAMLVNEGVGADRISTQGSPQDRPIQVRAQNRRGELTVTRK